MTPEPKPDAAPAEDNSMNWVMALWLLLSRSGPSPGRENRSSPPNSNWSRRRCEIRAPRLSCER